MKKVEVLPRASGGRKNDPTTMVHASGPRSGAKPPTKLPEKND